MAQKTAEHVTPPRKRMSFDTVHGRISAPVEVGGVSRPRCCCYCWWWWPNF